MKHLAPFYMKKVRFGHRLHRHSVYTGKVWQRWPCQVREGVVIGIRRLANGRVERWGEDGAVFLPDTYVLALLVVYSPYKNPVYVLPLDAQEIMPDEPKD